MIGTSDMNSFYMNKILQSFFFEKTLFSIFTYEVTQEVEE